MRIYRILDICDTFYGPHIQISLKYRISNRINVSVRSNPIYPRFIVLVLALSTRSDGGVLIRTAILPATLMGARNRFSDPGNYVSTAFQFVIGRDLTDGRYKFVQRLSTSPCNQSRNYNQCSHYLETQSEIGRFR